MSLFCFFFLLWKIFFSFFVYSGNWADSVFYFYFSFGLVYLYESFNYSVFEFSTNY